VGKSGKPFLSVNFFESCYDETTAILIFALLDLPLFASEDNKEEHLMKV
jgi:hypothetical protein